MKKTLLGLGAVFAVSTAAVYSNETGDAVAKAVANSMGNGNGCGGIVYASSRFFKNKPFETSCNQAGNVIDIAYSDDVRHIRNINAPHHTHLVMAAQ